jgi:PBP1b-binding outer membrane lipoprotein LpoB
MKYGIITITILMLLSGCDQPTPTVVEKEKNTAQVLKQTYLPPPPKKKLKLKEVDDTNFNTAYMYPEDSKKKEAVEKSIQTPVTDTYAIDKAECIAMITQEKFDKYAAMFGSEAASIKRCKMLKATR